ncbi:hypothetical protein BD311DRAFT_648954, partial [Dichomitus squalens]
NRAIIGHSNSSPSLSHIYHRITWDEVHLPHLGSPRHRRETIADRPCKPPACRSRTGNFTRLTSRHS